MAAPPRPRQSSDAARATASGVKHAGDGPAARHRFRLRGVAGGDDRIGADPIVSSRHGSPTQLSPMRWRASGGLDVGSGRAHQAARGEQPGRQARPCLLDLSKHRVLPLRDCSTLLVAGSLAFLPKTCVTRTAGATRHSCAVSNTGWLLLHCNGAETVDDSEMGFRAGNCSRGVGGSFEGDGDRVAVGVPSVRRR